jgi:hypothetical protein
MAFAATALTTNGLNRSQSLGPNKMQILTWSVASGDTSGTITADALSRVDQIILSGGLAQTAAPTYSGNVATIAFTDPVATLYGQVICIGV